MLNSIFNKEKDVLYRNYLRKILFIIFSLISIQSLYADNQLSNISLQQSKTDSSDCLGIDLYVEALYWYTSETIDWAFTLAQNKNTIQTSYKTFVFDWAPGFSIGLGYKMEHDNWDTRASYSWFQSKASGQANGLVTPGFLAARLSLLEPFSTGNASVNIHYNMFDWDIGREFLASDSLSLRPSIGLRGGWINQSIHSHWTTSESITASEDLIQTFQAGGAKGTATGKWYFCNTRNHTLSLIGTLEADYLWGHWDIQDQFVYSLYKPIYLKTTPRNLGSLVLYSFFGFEWNCRLNHDQNHLELKFGYEIEDWLDQCQIFTNISGSQSNDLILQGLNLGLNFTF